jgi:hypothetical protein
LELAIPDRANLPNCPETGVEESPNVDRRLTSAMRRCGHASHYDRKFDVALNQLQATLREKPPRAITTLHMSAPILAPRAKVFTGTASTPKAAVSHNHQ